jgi:hypothetical protein
MVMGVVLALRLRLMMVLDCKGAIKCPGMCERLAETTELALFYEIEAIDANGVWNQLLTTKWRQSTVLAKFT